MDKLGEFHNRSMKSLLQDNYIEMNPTHKDKIRKITYGKSVVAERFSRTLKNKIFKYMISI